MIIIYIDIFCISVSDESYYVLGDHTYAGPNQTVTAAEPVHADTQTDWCTTLHKASQTNEQVPEVSKVYATCSVKIHLINVPVLLFGISSTPT